MLISLMSFNQLKKNILYVIQKKPSASRCEKRCLLKHYNSCYWFYLWNYDFVFNSKRMHIFKELTVTNIENLAWQISMQEILAYVLDNASHSQLAKTVAAIEGFRQISALQILPYSHHPCISVFVCVYPFTYMYVHR